MQTKTGILTVGELKELLSKHSDSTQIVVAKDDWFANIGEIVEPDNDSYFAITIFTKDDFDARQF